MKALVLTLALLVTSIAAQARSGFTGNPGGPFGLGLVIGDPTALTAKYDANQRDAFDVGLSFNLDKWFLIYGDYQYKFAGLIRQAPQVTPYFGIGAVLVASNRSIDDTRHYQYFTDSTSSKLALGLRVPFGIEWRPNAPIGVFVELAPGIAIIPGTIGFFQGGIGIRYYF